MGGTHIDVTTLERNHYFFCKLDSVSCILRGLVTVVGLVELVIFYVFVVKQSVSNAWYT